MSYYDSVNQTTEGSYTPSAPPPPAYQDNNHAYQNGGSAYDPYEESYLNKFKKVVNKYEIHDIFANKLRRLEGYEICLICDDSGSMNTPLEDGTINPFGTKASRWDELKQTVGIIAEISTILDKDGIDVYFLNRPSLHNVTNHDNLTKTFNNPPSGFTPITNTLRQVIKDKKQIIQEKKLLIIIATDGEPTNDQGEVDTKELKNVLKKDRNSRIHVSFLACTDDDETMKYLNKWDNELVNLDVVDDFKSEKAQIKEVQGESFRFSFGDYICKILLGSIDKEIDNLDEKKSMCIIL
jgi:hypothetical protein